MVNTRPKTTVKVVTKFDKSSMTTWMTLSSKT